MKIALKLVVVFLLTGVGFAVGFFLTGTWYERTVMPALLKQYPHDGQQGLVTFVASINGGAIGALVGLCVGLSGVFVAWRRVAHTAGARTVVMNRLTASDEVCVVDAFVVLATRKQRGL